MKTKLFLLLLVVLFSYKGFSQKPLTLIIDTINFINDSDKQDFQISIYNLGSSRPIEIDTFTQVSTIDYPNFKITIDLISDSDYIQIPIDQQNGVLELRNIYNQDTIRINYLKQYSNCYRDTSWTVIEYYRIVNDSLSSNPYKIKKQTKTHKQKCERKVPFKTALIINGEKYFVSIQKVESYIDYTRGHGYKPKRYKSNSDKYKGKATMISISTITARYINLITIRVK